VGRANHGFRRLRGFLHNLSLFFGQAVELVKELVDLFIVFVNLLLKPSLSDKKLSNVPVPIYLKIIVHNKLPNFLTSNQQGQAFE